MDTTLAHPRITQNPAVMTGKPCIRDTRIPADLILRKLAAGETRERLLSDYAKLEDADLDAALSYAAAVVAGERMIAAE